MRDALWAICVRVRRRMWRGKERRRWPASSKKSFGYEINEFIKERELREKCTLCLMKLFDFPFISFTSSEIR